MKNHFNLACRISAALLMASATVRFLAGCFQNWWLKRHVSGKAGQISYVKDKNGTGSVYVTYIDKDTGNVIQENCTELFRCITWVDITRNVMVVLSALSMISYIASCIMQVIFKED